MQPQLHSISASCWLVMPGKLNYLEFLLLFDRQSPRSLTHQALLDLLCFQAVILLLMLACAPMNVAVLWLLQLKSTGTA